MFIWKEDKMGLFNRLFGKNQSDSVNQTNQPDGFFIVKHSYGEEQAIDMLQRANEGDVDSQLTIAQCFMDAAEQAYALPWYEKAAEAGNSQALHELTYFYEGCYADIEADPIKAEKVRNEALNMNNTEAILKLASKYYTGNGVEEDKEMAFKYYMKAAELGNDEAMAEVGLRYLNGQGIKQSDSQAFVWLSRSQDGLYGYYNLAQCYLKGIGTQKNLEKAVTYLEKAVECRCMNLIEARKQLLDLYNKGYGGSDSSVKLKQLQDDMDRNDKLINDLRDLIP